MGEHIDVLIETDKSFPLLKLPPELRNKVYFYAFGEHFQIQSMDYRLSLRLGCSMYSVCMESPEQWSWSHGSPMRVSSTSQSQIAILLANRQISEEALYVLYSASTFHFDDPESLAVFLLATPERHLALMTKLVITVINHPERSPPDAWMHYISIGVTCKMKHLKIFEVCIWATYPEPHLRRSLHYKKLGNSEFMPCLERGMVTFVGDNPRKKRAIRDSMGPLGLAQTIVKLILGKPRSSRGAMRWKWAKCSHTTTIDVSPTNTKIRTLNNG